MRNKLLLFLLVLMGAGLLYGCKKESEPSATAPWKKDVVTGTWKQKDILLSVTVKLSGQTLPAGSSMITLAPLLAQALKNPALAAGLTCTVGNTYSFNADGSFAITGCTDLILPNAGNSGKWELTVYDAVVQLTGAKGTADPHWINSITSKNMNLSLILAIPGVGNLPVGLVVEKQ